MPEVIPAGRRLIKTETTGAAQSRTIPTGQQSSSQVVRPRTTS